MNTDKRLGFELFICGLYLKQILYGQFSVTKETYEIIRGCMEVQRTRGDGFSEAIYKDALEMEFIANNFLYRREVKLTVT